MTIRWHKQISLQSNKSGLKKNTLFCFNHSEWIISVLSCYCTLNFVYDVDSRLEYLFYRGPSPLKNNRSTRCSLLNIPSSWTILFLLTGAVLMLNYVRLAYTKNIKIFGREPWSSGYRRRLIIKRSRVQILAPDGHFLTLICCKICIVCLKKTKNKRKRGWGWPIFEKTSRFHFFQDGL